VVEASSLKRWGWPAAALASAACIAVLAFTGSRPEPGLVRFEAAGLMRHLAPERVREVDVVSGTARARFARAGDGGWVAADGTTDGPRSERSVRLEEGLKLLHASGPERIMSADEVGRGATQEFGLDPPQLTVTVRASGAPPFTVHFGGRNPLGLARYARLEGQTDVILLPGFVAEAWERVIAAP